ncbi:hypothetical protein [Persephonella sp.]
MPSLDLEDFGRSLNKPDSKELSKEELEKFYQDQIKKLEKDFERKIQQSYEKGFEEGYKKASEEVEKTLTAEFEDRLKKALEEKEREYGIEQEKVKKQVLTFLKEVKDRYKKHIEFIDELILSVLEEIMEYLYINPENAEYVSEEIKKIIEDLKIAPEITVEVSPQLKSFIDFQVENIKIVERKDFEGGDFTVKIENVQFESRFKEKVNILKDEIKREIKKNSPL